MFKVNNKDLQYIKDLSWEEVFEIWRKNESYKNKWEAHYKSRGFNSWEEWRKSGAEPLHPEKRKWRLYNVKNPVKTVPEFRGGPFQSWVKYFYLGEDCPTLAKLTEHPGVKFHKGIREVMENFPKETIITGAVTRNGIVILEGMHRCLAIALANAEDKRIKTILNIALTEYLEDKMPILGGNKNL
jgi:hypothetical protein